MKRVIVILAAVLSLAAAADPRERLSDPAQEARARAVFREVRCLVCQNESIDDSTADLAGDLRKLVRDEIKAGRTDAEVKAYLVSRYGEFVLLKPTFSLGNAVLWGAPAGVVLLGLGLFLFTLRRPAVEPALTTEEAERIARLSQDQAQ
ncbi:MAG: cytochrome c-type biogenesis protein CcmH [Alphaproteobacteria bacterium PA2]|nr:MAG: cytochrome c-type biogenesis protein CcmH [Alphaproteobacteria bacterium PA2]